MAEAAAIALAAWITSLLHIRKHPFPHWQSASSKLLQWLRFVLASTLGYQAIHPKISQCSIQLKLQSSQGS
jgi:hypothetical protein